MHWNPWILPLLFGVVGMFLEEYRVIEAPALWFLYGSIVGTINSYVCTD